MQKLQSTTLVKIHIPTIPKVASSYPALNKPLYLFLLKKEIFCSYFRGEGGLSQNDDGVLTSGKGV